MPTPATTRMVSDPRITLRGPTRSSRVPEAMVATPAITLAAMAKMMTLPLEKPNVFWAMTPP